MAKVIPGIKLCLSSCRFTTPNQSVVVGLLRVNKIGRVLFRANSSLSRTKSHSMYREFAKKSAKTMSTFAGRDKDYIFRQVKDCSDRLKIRYN